MTKKKNPQMWKKKTKKVYLEWLVISFLLFWRDMTEKKVLFLELIIYGLLKAILIYMYIYIYIYMIYKWIVRR